MYICSSKLTLIEERSKQTKVGGRRSFTFTQEPREAYPKARFWDQSEWTSFLKSSVGETSLIGESGGTIAKPAGADWRFMTLEDGTPISNTERSAVRQTCFSTFHSMDVEWDPNDPMQARDPPPTAWKSGASEYYFNTLREALETKHPWVKCCSHSWKVWSIGIIYFPQYRSQNKAPRVANSVIKNERSDLEEVSTQPQTNHGLAVVGHRKREGDTQGAPASTKKAKVSLPAANPL